MLNGVVDVKVVSRLSSDDGKPRRNAAKALPPNVATLPFDPFDEVMSRSKSKLPAPPPGVNVSRPTRRESAPTLNVCVPTNLEKAALPAAGVHLLWGGLPAPN